MRKGGKIQNDNAEEECIYFLMKVGNEHAIDDTKYRYNQRYYEDHSVSKPVKYFTFLMIRNGEESTNRHGLDAE